MKAEMQTDIKRDSRVIRILPPRLRPYALLMRLDRPIGVWLLLLPGWWALALAAGGGWLDGAGWRRMALFAVGAVVMRGAGCVINDMWDRDLDARVARTRTRPLAAGTVGIPGALALLVLLLAVGLAVLLRLPGVTVGLGIAVLPLIVLYPLMKRWTWWPQLFLGIVFNFGALMGWSAGTGTLAMPAFLLYAGGIAWTLGYDTAYACQDREDDALAGVKSSALRLGARSKGFVGLCYGAALMFFVAACAAAGAGAGAFMALAAAALHTVWQMRAWNPEDPATSLHFFRVARDFGFLVLLAAFGA